ncbi:GEVED domain-containing protein [Desulfococcaceae bacterium HSG9]|nr:GEVED domain-containing protein [Desulfococcaceae bacterium HSG9]
MFSGKIKMAKNMRALKFLCAAILLTGLIASPASSAEWNNIGVLGGTAQVKAIAYDSDGNLYVGGNFDSVNGVTAKNIAKRDTSGTWTSIGGADKSVVALAFDKADNLYVGGEFDNVDVDGGGTTPALCIAKRDALGNWNALGGVAGGTPVNVVYALAVDSSDNLYVGGIFTSAGTGTGQITVNSLARMTPGGTWQDIGQVTGGGGKVFALALDSADNLFVGGDFAAAGPGPGTTMDSIAKMDSTGGWHDIKDVTAGKSVRALAFDKADNLYIGGSFTGVNAEALPATGIAKMTAAGVWSNIGNMGATVVALAFDKAGNLYAGGTFTSVTVDTTVVTTEHIAKMNPAGAWSNEMGGTDNIVNALAYGNGGDLCVGGAFNTVNSDSLNAEGLAQWNETDFGDAPDGVGGFTYPTLLANNGARHLISGNVYLGSSVDAENDGFPNATATGDDDNKTVGNDDEDGVTFGQLIRGKTDSVKVKASAACKLSAWIDFGGDTDWGDAGEQIFTDKALTVGDNALNFTIPGTAELGTTYARFRCTTDTGVSFDGLATDGEVEDYQVTIVDASSSVVTLIPPSGPVGIGTVIGISVQFVEPVTVTGGVPSLALNFGGPTPVYAYYTIGTGTNTLTFEYTLVAGDDIAKLDYWNSSALELNGAQIVNSGRVGMNLTLPTPGQSGSLGHNIGILFGFGPPPVPTVGSITWTSGPHSVGSVITISVPFSYLVWVKGIPSLALNTGGPVPGYAWYKGGSGTKIITFEYTVAAGDDITVLDYWSQWALELNGGQIYSNQGVDVDLDLPVPGESGSLGYNNLTGVLSAVYPVYRFYSPGLLKHLFTADENEKEYILANMADVWELENFPYSVFLPWQYDAATQEQKDTLMAVHRFYNAALLTHLYTVDANETAHLNAGAAETGWGAEGPVFYVPIGNPEGAIPVYRLYSETLSVHHYTVDENEKKSLEATDLWRYEGVAYYAYP